MGRMTLGSWYDVFGPGATIAKAAYDATMATLNAVVNATGVLSSQQKEVLIHDAAGAYSKAGMDPVQARKQAEQDITKVLVERHADPAQASFENAISGPLEYYGGGTKILMWGGAAVLLLLFLRD